MEKIIKIPIIQLGESLRNSYEGTGYLTIETIKTISKYNYRFHDEIEPRLYTRINLMNGTNLTVSLPVEDTARLFKCNFLYINPDVYSPVKNIVSISNYLRNEWRIDCSREGWNFRGDNIHIFNGDTVVRYNPDDLMSLWEKEITNKPMIKNLKVASGGNV